VFYILNNSYPGIIGHNNRIIFIGRNLSPTRDSLKYSSKRILPQRMRSSLSLEITPISPQMLQKGFAFHEIVMVSLFASAGTPLSASIIGF
jgi:hypothetical protein